MLRIKFAGFLFFCAVATTIMIAGDSRMKKSSDYLALAILFLAQAIPAALLVFFGKRELHRIHLFIKAAKTKIEAGGPLDIVELSREFRLTETKTRSILDKAKRRGILPPQAEIR